MKLIICLDVSGGISFNRRRLSRDRCVVNRILEISSGNKLWMTPYSRLIFPTEASINTSDNVWDFAGSDDYCFVENEVPELVLCNVDEIIVFWWNRTYPFDVRFPTKILGASFHKIYAEELQGHSHNNITLEVYSR